MQEKEIAEYLNQNVTPIKDSIYGNGYKAAVYLKDNTYLPCVIFRNVSPLVNLAIRRFKEEQTGKSVFLKSSGLGYPEIVRTFVASGNRIDWNVIKSVESSKYAFPIQVLEKIKGETTMSWTGFSLKMKDGRIFSFGTTFGLEFFDFPQGYTPNDIIEVINHSYVSKNGTLCMHKVPFMEWPEDYDENLIHREKPYFNCYIDIE